MLIVFMPMMTSQILKSVDFIKTLKSKHLERKIIFFFQIKRFINCTSRAANFLHKHTHKKKRFVAEVTLEERKNVRRIKNYELKYNPYLCFLI